MKNTILIFSLLSAMFSLKAQDPNPDLFNQNWYLYEIYDSDLNETFIVEGWQPYDNNPTIPQIMPQILIEQDLSFTGFGSCNTFEGTLEYDGTFNNFRTVAQSRTLLSCGFFEDQIENYVIGPFGYVDPDPTFFTIVNPQITTDSDGFQTLTYVTQPFVSYTYRNNPILSIPSYSSMLFSIYPNPTSHSITISEFEQSLPTSIQIFTVNGELVANHELEGSNRNIDMSKLQAGLYFVVFKSKTGTEIHKVVKK